jgi:hypothetical protein
VPATKTGFTLEGSVNSPLLLFSLRIAAENIPLSDRELAGAPAIAKVGDATSLPKDTP